MDATDVFGTFAMLAIMIMIVIVIVSSVMLLVFRQKAATKSRFESLAARFDSQLYSDNLLSSSFAFNFQHRGYQIAVAIHRQPQASTNAGMYLLNVRIGWPDRTSRLILYPETLPDRLKKFIGLEDIVIGSPHFDSCFIIQGNPDTVRELLTPIVQQRVDALALRGKHRDVHVSIVGGQFAASKHFSRKSPEEIIYFTILQCRDLYDSMIDSIDTGIQFVDDAGIETATVTNNHEATCMVCGESISEQKVYCRSCQTPHHMECWNYIGMCSTYGCGQRRFHNKPRKPSGSKSGKRRRAATTSPEKQIEAQREFYRDRN